MINFNNTAFNDFMNQQDAVYSNTYGTINKALGALTSQSTLDTIIASPAQDPTQLYQNTQSQAFSLFNNASKQAYNFDTPIFNTVSNTLQNYANTVGQAQLITANNSGSAK